MQEKRVLEMDKCSEDEDPKNKKPKTTDTEPQTNHEDAKNQICASGSREEDNITELKKDADGEAKFNGVEISKLSKKQLKKYNKCLKWQEVKKEKRAKQRLKNKERRTHARLNNIDLGPSRKVLKRSKMANSSCKIGVCIDLNFDDLMIDKDMSKTIKQILRIYTENRRAKAPMQLHLSDFNGKSALEMAKHHGYEHWDINFHPESYLSLFPKEKLVYLTSESDDVITELQPDHIYIIGGLVDHNSQKGICYRKAVEQGIRHAQLPIGKYFKMNHRKVLTINQVFEILLRVSEGKTFKEALELVIPKRVNMEPNEESCEFGEDQLENEDYLVTPNKEVSEGDKKEEVSEGHEKEEVSKGDEKEEANEVDKKEENVKIKTQ